MTVSLFACLFPSMSLMLNICYNMDQPCI